MATIQDILSEAVQRHQSGRLEAAAPLYALILKVDPSHADALHLLGMTRRSAGRWEDAARLIDRGLRVNGALGSRHAEFSEVLFHLGRFEAAIPALRETLRRNPQHALAFQMLGEASRRAGLATESLAAYRRALALQPDLGDSWYGMAAVVQGDAKTTMAAANRAAAALFARVVRLRPDLLFAWVNLAKIGRAHV